MEMEVMAATLGGTPRRRFSIPDRLGAGARTRKRERVVGVHGTAGYHGEMLLRPLRRAPMMLGGVGFQVGLDEARRKRQLEAQRQAAAAARQAPAAVTPDVVEQLKGLKALHDDGVLSAEEFQMAKRKVLGG
jgi:hypothetical protein